jgi:hypothetical protein
VYAPTVLAVNADACGNFTATPVPNIFVASQTLRAGNICGAGGHTTVHADGALVMKAAQSVELKPGFWAKPGGYAHAYIYNCTTGNFLQEEPETTDRSSLSAPDDSALDTENGLRIQPNPFRDFTLLEFTLTEDAPVDLFVFDAQGKLVRALFSGTMHSAGIHSVKLASESLQPGVYYCRLQAGKTSSTRKMVLMR